MNDLSGSKIDNIDSDIEPNLEIETEYKNTGRRVSNRSKQWAYRINLYVGRSPILVTSYNWSEFKKKHYE